MKHLRGWRAILSALRTAVRQGWECYKFQRLQQRAILRATLTDRLDKDASLG